MSLSRGLSHEFVLSSLASCCYNHCSDWPVSISYGFMTFPRNVFCCYCSELVNWLLTSSFFFLQIMFFLFMILGALLIVNMLIAMMGNTYLKVAETEKEWTRQVNEMNFSRRKILSISSLHFRKIFNRVSEVIWDCCKFAFFRFMIGPENLHHFLNQSDSKLKPIAT